MELEGIMKRMKVQQTASDAVRSRTGWTPEMMTGRWIEEDTGYGDTVFVCSNCGETWTLFCGDPYENNMNFCPQCGAYMRGGDEL